MAEGTVIWKSFIPADTDGNARVKSVFMKPKKVPSSEEKVEVSEQAKEEKSKKKVRGQNKHRPRQQRENISTRLCPSLSSGNCFFADKCKFLHDVNQYLASKPKDIADTCYSFDKHGCCPYSFTCRYGTSHTIKLEDNEYANRIDPAKMGANPRPKILNVLPRNLQGNLRKRKYDFDRTAEILKHVNALQAKRQKEEELRANGNADLTITAEAKSDIASAVTAAVCDKVKETANAGSVTDCDVLPLRKSEKKRVDFAGKLYLAPLTTCGNLPFRVVCKRMGADITCGEMALATNLLQGQTSEWALIKRHPCEDIFGVQLCGAYPDTMSRCAELLNKSCDIDFVDINMGCPIDIIFKKGSGSGLMRRTNKLFDIATCMDSVLDVPLTCKLRTGIESKRNSAHTILPMLRERGVALATLHGRSREARYTRSADWNYVNECARIAQPMPLFGNGDIFSYHDYYEAMERTNVAGIMIARGALIKPWIFTEIKERRDWDISASERFDVLRSYTNEGLVHWGSDTQGVENTRRFLLEWLSFMHRYIPVGVLEQVPQRINERPPYYVGRNDLETLLASPNCNDWLKISEMLLGPVPESFKFLPKHKANSYK